jgi:methyltransferase (TIGR00027 family)
MEEKRPSTTAEGAAVMRAINSASDAPLLIDKVAERIVDPAMLEMMRTMFAQMPPPMGARLHSMFALRSRYAEDCVAEAFERGIRQYVILGAGLDTFAYRQPPWAATLRIFEVDYPSTQDLKRARLAAAGIDVPDNVKLAAVDFEKVSLRDGLFSAGFDGAKPAILSMLGVSQYLSEAALDATLRFVLSLVKSSEIVFSFVPPDSDLPAEELPIIAMSTASAAAQGEPWLTRFPPAELEATLLKFGFAKVDRLSPEDATRRYFNSRADGATAFHMEQMIRATV